jgi:hypothetical protein
LGFKFSNLNFLPEFLSTRRPPFIAPAGPPISRVVFACKIEVLCQAVDGSDNLISPECEKLSQNWPETRELRIPWLPFICGTVSGLTEISARRGLPATPPGAILLNIIKNITINGLAFSLQYSLQYLDTTRLITSNISERLGIESD